LAAFTEAGITLGNRPAYCSLTALAAALVNLALGFLLIPRYGILGAGWATMIAFIVWNGLNLYFSTKFYALHFDVQRLLHSVVVGAALVAVTLVLPVDLSLVVSLPLKAAIAGAYPLLLLATGFLRPQEREFVFRAWQLRAAAPATCRSQLTTAE
jgi:O-antigen/teichoic acid export membrane protein